MNDYAKVAVIGAMGTGLSWVGSHVGLIATLVPAALSSALLIMKIIGERRRKRCLRVDCPRRITET